jgi:PAS domain S-box-containing protein
MMPVVANGLGCVPTHPMGYNTEVIQHSAGVRQTLPPHPSSVGEARRLVRTELETGGRADLCDTAELLISELVTNALVHAGTPIEVHARVRPAGLRVEITDGSAVVPAIRHHSSMAGTGRGLRLLQAMVEAWGTEPRAVGKTVWFELEVAERGGDGPLVDPQEAASADRTLDADGTVHIELLNVPLLLHVAWHQHAETLLREYLLVSLGNNDLDDADGGLDELVAHAAASEAIALLFEHLPDPGLGDDADELMVGVCEPHVSSVREVVPVPPEVLASFRVLGETLDAALVLADAGALLTSPTQPEIRAFRRWVCAEVHHQSAGADAVPWAVPPSLAPLSRPETGWGVAAVMQARTGLVAADDNNRIIAISAPALEMLGYAAADELVGHRLVEIIPERYRQAHLAGFTLYLSNGRAPLLDRPVRVPALCCDGSETELQLTVGSEQLAGGRHVFVAELARVPAPLL